MHFLPLEHGGSRLGACVLERAVLMEHFILCPCRCTFSCVTAVIRSHISFNNTGKVFILRTHVLKPYRVQLEPVCQPVSDSDKYVVLLPT